MSLAKKAINSAESTLLERSVSELKNAIKLFIASAKGESDDLDNHLTAMLAKLDTDEASFTFSQLVGQYKKHKKILAYDNEALAKQSRLSIINSIKECSKKSLSTSQTSLLNELKDLARNSESTDTDLLVKFGESLNALSEDISESRNKDNVIVSDSHKHIKENTADVVAGDIQASSKRLTREISNLGNRLSKAYPDDSEIKRLCKTASELKNQPNQFFGALKHVGRYSRQNFRCL